MSDPKRLLTDDDAGALEREMLSSWRTEGPSNEARTKTIAALGLGAGLAASSAAATGSIAPKAVTGAGLLVKWLTAALVVGAASTAVVVVVRARAHGEAVPSAPSAIAPAVAPSAAPLPISAPLDVPAVEASSLPPVVPTTAPRPSHKPATADLGPQIALMDRARASLAAGENAQALDLARRYRTSYPTGPFVEEADFVEVQALEKSGDDVGAKAAARRFLSAHPSSIHAAQVRVVSGL